jgi:hypothetical protein
MFSSADENGRGEARPPRTPSQLKGTRSLERLRDRIQLAARELHRLREENAALSEQVQTLQSRASGSVEGTTVTFTENPALLRGRIDSFLEAIDHYLERSAEPEADVTP